MCVCLTTHYLPEVQLWISAAPLLLQLLLVLKGLAQVLVQSVYQVRPVVPVLTAVFAALCAAEVVTSSCVVSPHGHSRGLVWRQER